jgi:hypothetical protein
VATLRTLGSLDVTIDESATDLDSHADQCAVGNNALIVHDYDRPINVSGYNPSGPIAKDLKTVSAALAYDDPVSGETLILMIHQAIAIPDIYHNLLSPMQLRLNDVVVNEVPRFLTEHLSEHTHSLIVPIDDSPTPYVIPLSLRGVTSTFPTRKPTVAEYESLPHLTLTCADLPWDPHDPVFANEEAMLMKTLSETGDRIGAAPPRRLCSVSNMFSLADRFQRSLDTAGASLAATSPTLEIRAFNRSISSLRSFEAGKQFDPQLLARNWGIDIQTVKRTVNVTTQRGVRTVLHPTLSRRFRANDRQLRYRRLPLDCFTDTLISNTKSRRNNIYAQVFATSDGWCRAYPMQKKSQAHEGLSLLFQREGVPNMMVMDGAREQMMGEFRKKCREVGT